MKKSGEKSVVRGWRISPRGTWVPLPAAGDSGIVIISSSSSNLLTSVDEVAISETGMINVVNDASKQRRQRLQLRQNLLQRYIDYLVD